MGSLSGERGGALADGLEVVDEALAFLLAPFAVGQAQQEARVDRDPAFATVGQRQRGAAHFRDGHHLADQRPRRGSTERDGQRRADQGALMVDPPAARLDLPGVGPGVDALLAALDKFEMLDRVGDIGSLPLDPGLPERLVEQLPGGADERPSGQIFLVAGLLADEQDERIERPFAEHGLRRAFVEVAARAARRLVPKRVPAQGEVVGDRRAPVCVAFPELAVPRFVS